MRQSTMGWLMMGASIFAIMIELYLAMYLSGNTLSEAVLYRDDRFMPAVTANVSPEDMPLRINLASKGVVRGGSSTNFEKYLHLTLHFGDGQPPEKISYHPTSNTKSRTRSYFTSLKSIMPENRKFGTWKMSLDVGHGKRVELDTIKMTIKANARPVDFIVITFFGVLAALGVIIAIMGHKQEAQQALA